MKFTRLKGTLRLAMALIGLIYLTPTMADKVPTSSDIDPFTWLEEVQGEKALNWVRGRNATTLKALQGGKEYSALHKEMLEVLNAKDRIPQVTRMGPWLYNLWQDEKNQRGVWRRTRLSEFQKAQPHWETVLDVDGLGATEKESWVFHGARCLGPDYRRCMVSLSRGGADASVQREFDTVDKSFVADGFVLPEAKSEVEWWDINTLFVGTDFGEASLTDSGYPRVIKRWKRGTPINSAVTVFEASSKDVAAGVMVDRTPGHQRVVLSRALDFYTQKRSLLQGDKLLRIDLPDDATLQFWDARMLVQLRSDWSVSTVTYPAGALLLIDEAAFFNGDRHFKVLFTPTKTRSLAGFSLTRSHVVLNISDQVASRLEEWSFVHVSRPTHRLVKAPFPGALSLASLYDSELKRDDLGEQYLLNYTDFLTPDTLFLAKAGSDTRVALKSREAQFSQQGMRTEQHFAISPDGTRVPYFVVWPAGAKPDGGNPTLLYGYGGFEVSMEPYYSGAQGRAWLGRGGVFVLANIRGGGEFGPGWHQAATKANKQRSYDDFIAVAQDLIDRKITQPRHLGIMGGSNGGLLVGATFVQRPDLFNAVVCQVPLLDMRRYHTLLAGASWMAEFGDPEDPAQWEYISRYSPYQNLKAGAKYPSVFFNTSTRDDRVHPGHARKMVARMTEMGNEVLYFENMEGGHGGAADNGQRATVLALEYQYLWQQLGKH